MNYEAKFSLGDLVTVKSPDGGKSYRTGSIEAVVFMRAATMPFYEVVTDFAALRAPEDRLEAALTSDKAE